MRRMSTFWLLVNRLTRDCTRPRSSPLRLKRLLSETADQLDHPFDVVVEFVHLGRRYPILPMNARPNRPYRIFAQKIGANLKPQHVASPPRRFILCVPVPR